MEKVSNSDTLVSITSNLNNEYVVTVLQLLAIVKKNPSLISMDLLSKFFSGPCILVPKNPDNVSDPVPTCLQDDDKYELDLSKLIGDETLENAIRLIGMNGALLTTKRGIENIRL